MTNVLILHGNSKLFSNTRWFTSSKAWEHQICCLKLFHPCHCFSQLRGVISKIEILLQSKMCSVSQHNPHACATIRPKKQTTTKFEEFSFTHICKTFCFIALFFLKRSSECDVVRRCVCVTTVSRDTAPVVALNDGRAAASEVCGRRILNPRIHPVPATTTQGPQGNNHLK